MLGAIDGKHIVMQHTPGAGSTYFNYNDILHPEMKGNNNNNNNNNNNKGSLRAGDVLIRDTVMQYVLLLTTSPARNLPSIVTVENTPNQSQSTVITNTAAFNCDSNGTFLNKKKTTSPKSRIVVFQVS